MNLTRAIAEILLENSASRDSDVLLLLSVWERQGVSKRSRYSAIKNKVLAGLIANPESVFRIRRLLQERNKDFRGEKYEERRKLDFDPNQLTIKFD